jgi:hypothetical protein
MEEDSLIKISLQKLTLKELFLGFLVQKLEQYFRIGADALKMNFAQLIENLNSQT